MSDNIKKNVDSVSDELAEALSGDLSEKEKKREEKLIAKAAKKEAKRKKKANADEETNADESSSKKDTSSADNSSSKEESSDGEASIDETSGAKVKKSKKRKKKKKVKQNPEDINIVKELLSLIVYIGVVVLACYLIINYVGCRSRVDGPSMNPTLSHGDNLWVDKLSYTFGDPKRFDVIIFNYDEDTTYVKRIIGLPGETVRIDQSGNIYINEKLLKENYGKENILPTNLGRANQPVVLGEDEYFVLGDNRNNSTDSRWADVGNVNREDIVGKVILRIYPFTEIGVIK